MQDQPVGVWATDRSRICGAGFAEAPATLIVTDLKPGTEYLLQARGHQPRWHQRG